MSSSTTYGSSMLGIGTSAAATEAKNCCVGACKCDAFRLLSRSRGRGGEVGCVSTRGSGVLGKDEARAARDRAANGRKGGIALADERYAITFEMCRCGKARGVISSDGGKEPKPCSCPARGVCISTWRRCLGMRQRSHRFKSVSARHHRNARFRSSRSGGWDPAGRACELLSACFKAHMG